MNSLGSHNHIVWSYFDIARLIAHEAETSSSDSVKRSKSAVVFLMAVAAVEAYINIFGRMWVEQDTDFSHATQIRDDIKNKKFITYKIKTWPQLFFGKGLDLSQGAGQEFLALVEKRNRLMHFTSDYHTYQCENVTIKGLVDSTVFDSLTPKDAEKAIYVAESFIEAWIRLQGLKEQHVKAATAHWTGNISSSRRAK
ncbi:hypothetical protein [Methylocaldum sp. RMAD-M]|jgi:hypothetical protein|uniref:hypothetical protein n=1 Tax=Methylocaldum sp. RMAD-M TaxID=2806557 RepID=UPI001AE3274E|nr:hypothetical protein [Methylocaldum sp. RMAD-M]MBP1152362.1 hypothetical protein [Methylocaldum sp. RMAD-M]